MTSNRVPLPWMSIWARSETAIFLPATPWLETSPAWQLAETETMDLYWWPGIDRRRKRL